MEKVKIIKTENNGEMLVGVSILDPEATLADLLEAWQPLCDDTSIYKLYAADNHASCKACIANCCNTAYVIPDLIAFRKMALALNCDYPEFISEYFQAGKVELGIPRLQPNPCLLLKDGICTVYPVRSLICRFYICTGLTGDTEQLIYDLAWTGAAATIVFARERGILPAGSEGGYSSFDLLFKRLLDEYQDDPRIQLFLHAVGYHDIPLKSFLPK
ncbi:MAG: YkgJ family cysteine cluster protein [Deltaproteobacteria bacterium]